MPTNTLIQATLGTTWSLCVLGILLVLARVLLILRSKATWALDYFWILVSTALSITFQILIELAVRLGAGLHLNQIDIANIVPAIDLFFKMCCLGVATVCTAKLAVVALLWYMETPTRSRKWKVSLIVTSILLIAIGVAQIVLVEISRRKIKTLVDLLNHNSITVLNDSFDFAYGFGAFSGLVDLYLTIYPAILVWKVCKSRATQIVAMIPITLGIVPIVAAVIRTVALHDITAGDDVTYNAAVVLLCFSTEYGATAVLVSIVPVGAALLNVCRGYGCKGRPEQGFSMRNDQVELLDTKTATVRETRCQDSGFVQLD